MKYDTSCGGNATKYGRSREGAWIEIVANKLAAESYNVAPVRERGLKF